MGGARIESQVLDIRMATPADFPEMRDIDPSTDPADWDHAAMARSDIHGVLGALYWDGNEGAIYVKETPMAAVRDLGLRQVIVGLLRGLNPLNRRLHDTSAKRRTGCLVLSKRVDTDGVAEALLRFAGQHEGDAG